MKQVIRRWGTLFLISMLSLYLELAVIRWLSAEIRLLAYFKNLILLAAFLGLSIGFALVGKGRDYRFSFTGMWGILAPVVVIFSFVSVGRPIFYPGGGDEYLWNVASLSYWTALILFIATILVFFFFCVLLFIPLGQAVGEEMANHIPIKAYIVNIFASLTGVWLFSFVSYLQTPPVVWFSIGLIGMGIYYLILHKLKIATGFIFAISLVVIGMVNQGSRWSPYSRLDLTELTYNRKSDGQQISLGYLLDVQQTFHQSALDLSKTRLEEYKLENDNIRFETAEETAKAYELPYQLVGKGSHILIVGSGMGNDVAAALRSDMGQINAVEIDPEILSLGKQLHPEQPYSDVRVIAIEADARSFFNQTDQRYDLIVFGLLDSHTLLSSLSSVRLDSYVYTIDSFELVRGLLNDNGVLTITFATNEWIEERLGRMMSQVFGKDRIYLYRGILGSTFVAGDITVETISELGLFIWQPDPGMDDLALTTDDWPYLYMRARTIPAGYWQALLVIGLVSLFIIHRSFPETLKPDWHFWFLGAAFLLIEFKSITELALLFGTTWFVNSLAISGVLIMALMANIFVMNRTRIHLGWAYGLLFGSLLLGYIIPLEVFAGLPVLLKGICSTVMLSLPLLFAGVIFSESLRRAGETARPLASNFSGSAVGGLLEYGSLLWGIKSLYGIGILLYAAALLAARKKKLS
jgi:hypothetical protein